MVNQGNRNLWRRMGETKKVRVADFEEEEKWQNYWREREREKIEKEVEEGKKEKKSQRRDR